VTVAGTIYRPTKTERAVLYSLYLCKFLIAEQVCRLHFAPSSLTHVQELLKRLTDTGFVMRGRLERETSYGSGKYVYHLATAGYELLDEYGYDVSSRFRPSEVARQFRGLAVLHTLELNNLYILTTELPSAVPSVVIRLFLHERFIDSLLRRQHLPVRIQKQNRQYAYTVIPDAWIDLRLRYADRDRPLRFPIIVEIDMGTHKRERFQDKVQALLVWMQTGVYERQFGTEFGTIAFVTPAGQKRLLDMVTWTEEVLSQLGAEDQADLFLFTDASTITTLPYEFFFGERWLMPFHNQIDDNIDEYLLTTLLNIESP
jgi:hypothetical protein